MNANNHIKNHVLFSEYNHIKQLCEPLNSLGVIGFIYMRHFPDGSFIDLSNQLEWSEFFLRRYFDGLYKDSLVQDHMFIESGISLWNLNQENVIWQEGREYFNFGNGITIPFKNKGYNDVFCFYAKCENTSIDHFYLTNIDLLKQFCTAFLENAAGIIKKGYRNKLMTPNVYLSSKPTSDLPDELRAKFKKMLQNNFPDCLSNKLTSRQLACIEYSAFGHSAKTIAEKLSISHRTVQDHLEQAKNKLGSKNLVNLIYLCAKHNLID